MEKIKNMIQEISLESRALIKDTIFIDRKDISINEELKNYHKILASKSHLGGQYIFLASYADYYGIEDLELCIHKDDNVGRFISKNVELINDSKDTIFNIVENPSDSELALFSYFNFPLFLISKLEMAEESKKKGFSHIMEETWFCFNPLKDGKPCGFCNPCKYTREEGLGRRVPEATLYRRFQVFSLKVRHRLKL